MANEKFLQQVFLEFQSCYTNNYSNWDIISIKKHFETHKLTDRQILDLLKNIAESRTINDFRVPPPSFILEKIKRLKAHQTIKNESNFIFTDCQVCYNSGVVNAALLKSDLNNESNYNLRFLCLCNNSTKAAYEDKCSLKKWNEALSKVLAPFSCFIEKHFGGDYNIYINNKLEKIIGHVRVNKKRTRKTLAIHATDLIQCNEKIIKKTIDR